jgi:hypothetical protein
MRSRKLQVVTWAFSWLVPRSEREAILGDLAEEYSLRVKAVSSGAASEWYLRQIFTSAASLLWARVCQAVWPATLGVALLGYIAVGVAEFVVNLAISHSSVSGSNGYSPAGMVVTFPIVVLIGYWAERFRRKAAIALGAMLLLVVTVMTASSSESLPLWYRIAYFVAGPAAALIGGNLPTGRRLSD